MLRAVNFRDTSKVVTFYTRRYGKMSAIAKGVRNPKSKYGSLFQPTNYLQIVFYRRENREMQYVSSSEFVKYFKKLGTSIERLAIAMSLVEIVDRLMHDEEENERVFTLLVESLNMLDTKDVQPQNVFAHFGLHLSVNLGFEPGFDNCLICGKRIDLEKEKRITYVVRKGNALCENCSANVNEGYIVSAAAMAILRHFIRMSSEEAGSMVIEQRLQNELSNFVFVYLRKHSENLRELKSLKFLSASK